MRVQLPPQPFQLQGYTASPVAAPAVPSKPLTSTSYAWSAQVVVQRGQSSPATQLAAPIRQPAANIAGPVQVARPQGVNAEQVMTNVGAPRFAWPAPTIQQGSSDALQVFPAGTTVLPPTTTSSGPRVAFTATPVAPPPAPVAVPSDGGHAPAVRTIYRAPSPLQSPLLAPRAELHMTRTPVTGPSLPPYRGSFQVPRFASPLLAPTRQASPGPGASSQLTRSPSEVIHGVPIPNFRHTVGVAPKVPPSFCGWSNAERDARPTTPVPPRFLSAQVSAGVTMKEEERNESVSPMRGFSRQQLSINTASPLRDWQQHQEIFGPKGEVVVYTPRLEVRASRASRVMTRLSEGEDCPTPIAASPTRSQRFMELSSSLVNEQNQTMPKWPGGSGLAPSLPVAQRGSEGPSERRFVVIPDEMKASRTGSPMASPIMDWRQVSKVDGRGHDLGASRKTARTSLGSVRDRTASPSPSGSPSPAPKTRFALTQRTSISPMASRHRDTSSSACSGVERSYPSGKSVSPMSRRSWQLPVAGSTNEPLILGFGMGGSTGISSAETSATLDMASSSDDGMDKSEDSGLCRGQDSSRSRGCGGELLLLTASELRGQLEAILDDSLVQFALSRVVPVESAMHPQRAAGGSFLLQHVAGAVGGGSDASKAVVRRLFLDSIPSTAVDIDRIDQVIRPQLLKRFLEKVAEERASVEVTFHGTRAEHVEQILREGLNPSICVTGAYGRGAYVATHAGVAHQYADPDENGWRHMCAILVVVGSRVMKGNKGEAPSVTAVDRLVNPTQYCFLDEDRLYVSHLIRYRVRYVNTCRTGGGFQDLFQRKLCAAIRADATRRQQSGVR